MTDRTDLLDRAFDYHSLVALRHEVQRAAEATGLGELDLYRFVLAVNEVTTNAVQHGGGSGRIELWRTGGRLHCRVTDSGPGMPTSHAVDSGRPAVDALSGRGLWLVRQVAAHVAIRSGVGGTCVTLTAPG